MAMREGFDEDVPIEEIHDGFRKHLEIAMQQGLFVFMSTVGGDPPTINSQATGHKHIGENILAAANAVYDAMNRYGAELAPVMTAIRDTVNAMRKEDSEDGL